MNLADLEILSGLFSPVSWTDHFPLDISDTAYRISIQLDDLDPHSEGMEETPTLILQVSYPKDYPEVAPDLELLAPPNAPRNSRLDLQEDRAYLLQELQSTIEENIGMAMVFTLVSTLKETAETLMADRAAATQAVKEREIAKAEEEENRKFQGTIVTKEKFLEWRESFRKEMEGEEQRKVEEKEAEEKKRKPSAKEETKLTGRQLWEGGLAGKADYDEEGEEEIPAAVEKMKIVA
jgi:hypothetical protein